MVLEVRKIITILEECCMWYILKDFFIGLRGGFEKHCTRASLHSDTVEDLIRISVEGGGGFEKHCTRASLHSDTVEDLIRISVEGQVWKMLMLERVWPAGLAAAKDQEG